MSGVGEGGTVVAVGGTSVGEGGTVVTVGGTDVGIAEVDEATFLLTSFVSKIVGDICMAGVISVDGPLACPHPPNHITPQKANKIKNTWYFILTSKFLVVILWKR